MLSFDGKVAIVTGAGGGLGKEYAVLLGEKGAAVVVNDLGGTKRGEGNSRNVADIVVEEIQRKGGKAVANYDSVEDAEKILKTAIDTFGRIDILINNAGILRDRAFLRMSDDDWDMVQRVHLRGAFLLTRACWPHFRKQNYGRIIMTSSLAGLCGNFGQANYSAAKMGLVGLSNTLSIEGSKYNIYCNTVVPMAGSRLTQDIIPPDIFNELGPEYIAPVVVWLCHESCLETGGIFEVAGGWVGKYQWQRSQGVMLRKLGVQISPEAVRDSWDKATDMNNPLVITAAHESLGAIMDLIEKSKNSANVRPSKVSGINVEKAINHKFPPTSFTYTSKDVILYALGVGVSTTEKDHLRFLYENSPDFCALPTFGIVPMQSAMFASGIFSGIEGMNINLTQVIHGEQYLEVLHPLLPEDTLESHASIADVLDKGSGALILINVDVYRGKIKIIHAQSTIFVVGAGKFGGKRTSDKVIETIKTPTRKPDVSVKKTVAIDQAALYRLSGDVNPLHIDPDFSVVAGFSRPILHGLCTYGIMAREVMKCFADSDPNKFHSFKARFSKPVYPGQTIQINMWQDKNRIYVQCNNLESGETVVTDSYIDLKISPSKPVMTESISNSQTLKCDTYFEFLRDNVDKVPGLGSKVNAVFQFNVLKNGSQAGQWTLDLRASIDKVRIFKRNEENLKPNCTITMEDDDIVDLIDGKLNGQKAFATGKMKITGNIMLATKLQSVFKANAKL